MFSSSKIFNLVKYKGRLKCSCDDVISIVDDFLPIGSKHFNTDGRMEETMLKIKPHLVTFQESIWVSLLTF